MTLYEKWHTVVLSTYASTARSPLNTNERSAPMMVDMEQLKIKRMRQVTRKYQTQV